ncbi:unnamed protein product [marine sediment metagenome]|uniref:Uncharacterized protein n=1 Tax=marine sediment metagenome TaxID=412755 RepID=X1IGA2_9ZZZZ
MAIESIDRMTQEQIQLHEHEGPYYEDWLKRYRQSLRHCRRVARAKKLPRSWYKGVKKAVKHLEKERNANT